MIYFVYHRRLKKRLEQLGSSEIISMGLGDDQSQYGYFTELDSWINKLKSALLSLKRLTVFSTEKNVVVGSADSSNDGPNSPHQYEVEIPPKPISSTGLIKQNEKTCDQQQYRLLPFGRDELESLHSILIPPDNHKHKHSQINGVHKKTTLLPIMSTVKVRRDECSKKRF